MKPRRWDKQGDCLLNKYLLCKFPVKVVGHYKLIWLPKINELFQMLSWIWKLWRAVAQLRQYFLFFLLCFQCCVLAICFMKMELKNCWRLFSFRTKDAWPFTEHSTIILDYVKLALSHCLPTSQNCSKQRT